MNPFSTFSRSMNDFPVIGDLVMRTGLWDRQGGNHCKVVGHRMPHFAMIL